MSEFAQRLSETVAIMPIFDDRMAHVPWTSTIPAMIASPFDTALRCARASRCPQPIVATLESPMPWPTRSLSDVP
ncbi:hypothetical protein [Burkholderia sp. 22PA0106]|uniref:hypothetical protein n=1 Tax=Burkholderia sp. 22PA0106 TaxID=3237371 RepID=UPI0039C492C2